MYIYKYLKKKKEIKTKNSMNMNKFISSVFGKVGLIF